MFAHILAVVAGDSKNAFTQCFNLINQLEANSCNGQVSLVSLLFSHCLSIASVNSADRLGNSPLMLAVTKIKSPEHRLVMVKLLLSHGADVCHCNNKGQTVQDFFYAGNIDRRTRIDKQLATAIAEHAESREQGKDDKQSGAKRQRTK